jgi:glutathione S-transferase
VPLIALEEIGAPFTATVVPFGWRESLEYRELNPKGKVPTLIIDGVRFTETLAIVMHLARTHPDARLLPNGDPLVEIDVLTMMA